MSVKIIAADLDGTLMAGDHLTVTPRTVNALLEAHSRGVKIAIATGRTLNLTDNVVSQIPFVDYVIYSNGACVYDMKKQADIYKNNISAEATGRIIDFLNERPAYYSVYSQGKIFVQKGQERYYKNDALPKDFLESFIKQTTVCDDIRQSLKGEEAEIFAVYADDPKVIAEVSDFFAAQQLTITSSLPGEVEATNKNADKGSALKGLCDMLGIEPHEAMSFGDAGNDCSMLLFAGYSFAMENSMEICKKTAKYIAPSNLNDGVAVIVEKYTG